MSIMKKGTFYFLIGILISGTIAFVSIDKNVDTTNDFVKNYSKILLLLSQRKCGVRISTHRRIAALTEHMFSSARAGTFKRHW